MKKYRLIEKEYNDHFPENIRKFDFDTLPEVWQKYQELVDSHRDYYGEPNPYFSYEIKESYEKVVVETCWKTIETPIAKPLHIEHKDEWKPIRIPKL